MFITAAICVLPLIFSSCSGDFFDNEYVDIILTDSEVKETASEQTMGFIGEVTAAEEPDIFSDIVEQFPIDTIYPANGTSVDKYEATGARVDKDGRITLEFDFWYMRYEQPYFASNIEGLGEYKESLGYWETQYENFLEVLNVKYEDYFKVKSEMF